jgi:hypothetical protein
LSRTAGLSFEAQPPALTVSVKRISVVLAMKTF